MNTIEFKIIYYTIAIGILRTHRIHFNKFCINVESAALYLQEHEKYERDNNGYWIGYSKTGFNNLTGL